MRRLRPTDRPDFAEHLQSDADEQLADLTRRVVRHRHLRERLAFGLVGLAAGAITAIAWLLLGGMA